MSLCVFRSVCCVEFCKQQHGWFIKAGESFALITILQGSFSRITCAWVPKSWHAATTTEMRLWQCWCHTYTQAKSMKYLGRKWQLSSHITFFYQIQAHTWMNKYRLDVIVFISLSPSTFHPLQTSSKDTERRQTENRRRQPDIETRWAGAVPM